MNGLRQVYLSALLLGLLQTPVHAEESAAQAPAASASVATPAKAPAATPAATALSARQLPQIKVRWDCGDCVVNPKVAPLLEQEYAAAATAGGYGVSTAETAELVITSFRQRSPGARIMFGFMAGKDKLGARIAFRGKEYSAEDYSANAISGMNNLCKEVARLTAMHLMTAVSNL